jgi:cysteine desulfurase
MHAYLDHAATTPMWPQAVVAMSPFFTEHFGNPSGSHGPARAARQALEDAREDVAALLGCGPGDVIFTAGGTESDNLALRGVPAAPHGRLCSAIEHDAVLKPCLALGGSTFGVDASGFVDLDALSDALHPGVSLVSVMLANNEVGTIQPLEQVVAVVRERAPDALVHTDAVHAVPWLDVGTLCSDADLLSISAHKFGGPKGMGVLVVRSGVPYSSVFLGGMQERGRRPGTNDVAGAVGMAAALRATTEARAVEAKRIEALRDRLADGLIGRVEGVVESGVRTTDGAPRSGKVTGSCHLRIDGVDNEELLLLLDDAGVHASAGSACASGAMEPSHVLLAMGVSAAEARTAVRLSLGYTTTAAEIDLVLDVMPQIVQKLRR